MHTAHKPPHFSGWGSGEVDGAGAGMQGADDPGGLGDGRLLVGQTNALEELDGPLDGEFDDLADAGGSDGTRLMPRTSPGLVATAT